MPRGSALPDVDLAVADRLLEAGQLLDLEHPADDERAGDLLGPVDLLDLEAEAHERGVEVLDRGPAGMSTYSASQPMGTRI